MDCLIYGGYKWYWDEVKYPEVWESVTFVFQCVVWGCTQRSTRQLRGGWGPALPAQTAHPSHRDWDTAPHLSYLCPSSLLGQSKTLCFFTPQKEGEQMWICFKMLWLGPNSNWDELLFLGAVLSWGNYPKREVFIRDFFFFNNNLIKLHIEIRIQSIRFMLVVDYF